VISLFSKLFPSDEQLWNRKETFESRIIAYTPEVMMMEWKFPNAGHVIPLHDHYHVQMSYILKGSAKITLADGTEKLCKAGDAVAFAPNEAHSVITAEPDTVIMDVFTPIRLDHLANHKKEE
jgi:Uncharacterized conserved protein, contains double-stranded beta-helix domain